MVQSLLLLSCESSVSVKEYSDRERNYSTFTCTFEPGKCGKGKNYKNSNNSRTKRVFICHKKHLYITIVSEGLSFGVKLNNSGHKL